MAVLWRPGSRWRHPHILVKEILGMKDSYLMESRQRMFEWKLNPAGSKAMDADKQSWGPSGHSSSCHIISVPPEKYLSFPWSLDQGLHPGSQWDPLPCVLLLWGILTLLAYTASLLSFQRSSSPRSFVRRAHTHPVTDHARGLCPTNWTLTGLVS